MGLQLVFTKVVDLNLEIENILIRVHPEPPFPL